MIYVCNVFKKEILRSLPVIIFALTYTASSGSRKQTGHFLAPADTAFVPKEIEDPQNIGINKEAAHATLMPYGSLKEALAGNRYFKNAVITDTYRAVTEYRLLPRYISLGIDHSF